MNVDRILSTFNEQGVRYLLLGGMNFMLRHQPILTYDVDLWIEDLESNRLASEKALVGLEAEWGATDDDWGCVAEKPAGWLDRQAVFCLTSPAGAIDIFRMVRGLEDWSACWDRSHAQTTGGGVSFHGLSDEDMLECQLALPKSLQKRQRVDALKAILGNRSDG